MCVWLGRFLNIRLQFSKISVINSFSFTVSGNAIRSKSWNGKTDHSFETQCNWGNLHDRHNLCTVGICMIYAAQLLKSSLFHFTTQTRNFFFALAKSEAFCRVSWRAVLRLHFTFYNFGNGQHWGGRGELPHDCLIDLTVACRGQSAPATWSPSTWMALNLFSDESPTFVLF